jgi:SAM-dependent methyltransferase
LPSVAPLADLSDATCAALLDRLAATSNAEEVVQEMEGIAAGLFGGEARPIIYHALARRQDAAGIVARLFAFDDAVDEPAVLTVLGDRVTAALLDAGVLTRDVDREGALRCPFRLRPFEGLWLLADEPGAGRDAVMPAAGTTRQLTSVMPPTIAEHVLDIGCGPGSLALVAAQRGAPGVVGTDANARAIDLARFNARLNNVAHTEFLVGDLVAPVDGRRFGLVVAQPPFVIQPPGARVVTFLHGGPSGDELALRLVAAVPSVLAPGGRALVLMEGVARPNEPLHARLRDGLSHTPVDVLVLAAPGPPPAVQVIAYASFEAPGGGRAYAEAARRYAEHLEHLGAASFQHALVVVRAWPPGATDRRHLAATLPVGSIERGDSAALERLLANVDLAALDDTRLAHHAVRAAGHVRWREERARPDAASEPMRSVRFEVGSFGADIPIDAEGYALCGVLDRAATIEAGVKDWATALGAQPESVRVDVLGFVREGLMRGLFEVRSALG